MQADLGDLAIPGNGVTPTFSAPAVSLPHFGTVCPFFRFLSTATAANVKVKRQYYGSLIMRRFLTIVIGLLLGLNLLASPASAQWMYPRGYGGYGMSQWGADPASGLHGWAWGRTRGVRACTSSKKPRRTRSTSIRWSSGTKPCGRASSRFARRIGKRRSSGKPSVS